jgi:NADH-quinone oxidoreductase subunit N
MNSAMIWVFLPIFSAVFVWLLRDRPIYAKALALATSFLLLVLTLIVPLESVIQAGPFMFQISSEMNILGRKLIIAPVDLPLLTLLYSFAVFWFIGTLFLNINRHFPAISLLIVGLLIAAISVEPFLYAALIIEMIVLTTIPVFIQEGKPVGKGLIRFLQFQTLAMPFILYAGWTIMSVEANSFNQIMIQQTIIAFGLGFALWLAVFPFYSWIPLLTAESEPYAVGFLLLFYPIATIHLGMKFLNEYSWLRASTLLMDVIQGAGLLLIISSGVFSLYQKDIRKLFGYLVLLENGFSLLAISINTGYGYQLYFSAMFPRLLIYALWCYTITKRESVMANRYENEGRQGFYDLILIFTMFSSIGLPLFAMSSVRIQLLHQFTGQALLFNLLLASILGYSIGVLRMIYSIIQHDISFFRAIIPGSFFRIESMILMAGIAFAFVIGIAPGLFGNATLLLIQIYDKLIA